MFAVLTKTFWLSVFLPATAAIGLIIAGTVKRKLVALVVGTLGLLLSVGWLVLGLYVEAVVR